MYTQFPHNPQPVVLRCHRSPGDIVILTAVAKALHQAYRERIALQADTSHRELWDHNPHVQVVSGVSEYLPESQVIQVQVQNLADQDWRNMHYIEAVTAEVDRRLHVRTPVRWLGGDLHLSEAEKSDAILKRFGLSKPFWIIVAGGKTDMTTKWWPPLSAQMVVTHFRDRMPFVQCGRHGDWHEPLRGVRNLVGRTTLREFLQLIYHARGVVCPVTFAMHAAAAVPAGGGRHKPCVVIAGGRESPAWNRYPGQTLLSTVGDLSCCRDRGCWRARCQLIGDGDWRDRQNLCDQPVQVRPDLRIPACMTMITPGMVIDAVESLIA